MAAASAADTGRAGECVPWSSPGPELVWGWLRCQRSEACLTTPLFADDPEVIKTDPFGAAIQDIKEQVLGYR